MAKTDIGLNDTIKYKPFPVVFTERCEIGFRFEDTPNPNKNKYEMVLHEYIKDKPVKRTKMFGYWTRGTRITFNTSLDYYVIDGREYMLEVTYHNDRNIEVTKSVWIKVKD
jgi:hypothetical protein